MTFSINKYILLTLAIFVSLFTVIGISYAQNPSLDSVSLSTSPQFVAPGEEVTVSVTSRLINLNSSEIVWTKNGRIIASGTGLDEVTTTAGSVGEDTTVKMETQAPGGGFISEEVTITPADVDLVWEAVNSYTPPLYKGKALHPGWGDVRVTAIPHIKNENGDRYGKNELVYTWTYNGLVYGNDSGRGENSFTIEAVPRDGNRVTVEIETPEGERVVYKSITIPNSQPEVIMYKGDRLQGTLFSQAVIDDFVLEDSEIQLSAYPYFYLTDSAIRQNLVYDWSMNGESVNPAEDENMIRLRQRDNISGRANISLEIKDEARIFPDDSTSASFEF